LATPSARTGGPKISASAATKILLEDLQWWARAFQQAGAAGTLPPTARSAWTPCRSLSVLCAGGGQPLVEPDGLVTVGAPRME
jgi:hypothetical protein